MKNPLHQCFWTAICVSSQTVNATEMRKVHFYFSCWHDMRAKNHGSWNQIQESYTSPELGVQTSLRHIWHIFPGTLPTCQLRRSSNKCKFLCPQGREDAGIHPRLLRVKAGSHPGRVDSLSQGHKDTNNHLSRIHTVKRDIVEKENETLHWPDWMNAKLLSINLKIYFFFTSVLLCPTSVMHKL